MPALICGSLAFDMIANYDGRFADAILPDQLHIMNVSFLVPDLRHEYGGCAGNIAYSLKSLGGSPRILAPIGHDSGSYMQHFKDLGIDTSLISMLKDHYTAQCFITTDIDNNQITAFHPGAMNEAHTLKVPQNTDVKIGIIAPDGRQAMIDHAQQMKQAGIPFIFDPGQGLPMFDGNDLKHFISQATWVAMNDYEGKLLCERTGLTLEDISRQIPGALFVTLGGEGCDVWEQGQKTHIPPVKAHAIVDPTGCGDAFRGALLYGLEQNWPATACARLGNMLGALKIASQGPQNYQVPSDLASQFSPT